MTAGRIRALLDSGMEVTDADTGQRRRVEPRDIVILLRQRIGDGISHFAVADNNNFHIVPPVKRFSLHGYIF